MDISTELKALWQTVFKDDSTVTNAFFDTFPMSELAAYEYIGETLAAAAYVLPFGELVNNEGRFPCAHIYAVAVHPDFRGRGLGITVTNSASALAERMGFSAVVLHPASADLFSFYKRHCGFSTVFTYHSVSTAVSHLDSAFLSPSDPFSYARARERMLSQTPHIDISPKVFELFTRLGGRLYIFNGGCAAVEDVGDTAFFRELLCAPQNASLGSMTHLSKAVVCSPGTHSGYTAPFGMIKGTDNLQNVWMGIALE